MIQQLFKQMFAEKRIFLAAAILLFAASFAALYLMLLLLALLSHSITLRHLGWENVGQVIALNSYERKDIEKTNYPQEAYELGKAVK